MTSSEKAAEAGQEPVKNSRRIPDPQETAEGFDALYGALGLQRPRDRTDVLGIVEGELLQAGFDPTTVWVESYRYQIVRLGSTHGQYRYVKAAIAQIETRLKVLGHVGVVMRVSKRKEAPKVVTGKDDGGSG